MSVSTYFQRRQLIYSQSFIVSPLLAFLVWPRDQSDSHLPLRQKIPIENSPLSPPPTWRYLNGGQFRLAQSLVLFLLSQSQVTTAGSEWSCFLSSLSRFLIGDRCSQRTHSWFCFLSLCKRQKQDTDRVRGLSKKTNIRVEREKSSFCRRLFHITSRIN